MQFEKKDLAGNHYHWDVSGKQSIFLGHPSRRSFDRYNGDQVLFIINLFGSISNKMTLSEGRSLEYAIFHQLPLEAKSEISVFNWIREMDFSEINNEVEISNLK